ncbi:copper resistance protein CopD [Trinickia symbiotica]|uniref:Copper resistance protein CopD n=1 Tax=Trinickia symbiotica TaxID=863227 RepID=A0A2T3XQ85_9BURK|nr:CopD family protein [Trinickia symbiotica]PTB18689.1 copper resistance protein CopD [Trinickia symbiotica]
MNLDGLLIGQATLAALMNIAFALVVGSALFERWLAGDGAGVRSASSHSAWHRARSSIVAAALVLVLADGGWLVYEAASMSGAGLVDGVAYLPDVLVKTHVGHAWCVAFGGAAVLVVAACMYRGGPFGRFAMGLAALACASGAALLGHAADAGAFSFAAATQVLHVLSTAVWGGLVLAGGFVVLPALDASTTRGAMIRMAGSVSTTSLVALVVVAATGLVSAERGLGGTLTALRTSTWGHVLALKAALVLFAIVLGGLNRISVLPRLRRSASTADAHTFNNVLHLEAFVILGVFIAAAVLALTPPA